MTQQIASAIQKSKQYIDGLTIHSAHNIPREIVSHEDRYFSWDNEKRSPVTEAVSVRLELL